MGSGKSSVGRRLATMTGHRFVDTDERITRKAGMPITKIFAERGEDAFRDLETEALRGLEGVCGVIAATGGGIVLREENRSILARIGVVCWLDAEPDVLFERVSRTNKRPLLKTENPRQSFDELLAARAAVYRKAAHFRVDSTGLSHAQTARKVLEEAQRFRAAGIRN